MYILPCVFDPYRKGSGNIFYIWFFLLWRNNRAANVEGAACFFLDSENTVATRNNDFR